MGEEQQAAASSAADYTTIIILVSGVFGGLGLVIILILCCKHCIRKPPQTGLDVEDFEEKLPVFAAPALTRECYSPTKTQFIPREATRSLSTTNMEQVTGNIAVCSDKIMDNGWNELNITENLDYYERCYPQQSPKAGCQQWFQRRDSILSQNGMQSRAPSKVRLSSVGNSGSHRTLRSSVEGSLCLDNSLDIATFNGSIADTRERDVTGCNGSAEEHSNTANEAAAGGNGNFLLPCRPILKRGQSTHEELTRQPREMFDRLIKSQDDTSMYRFHRDVRLVSNIEDNCNSYTNQFSDETDKSRRFQETMRPQINPRMHVGDRERPEILQVYLQPHPHETADLDNQSVSSRNSSQSWRGLWQLRSMLEQQSMCGSEEVTTGEEIDLVVTSSDDCCGREEGSCRKNVCNVVYTRCDFNNSEHDQDALVGRNVPTTERHGGGQMSTENFLHPPQHTYSFRRKHFQQQTGTGSGRVDAEGNSSTEKSIDSFETATTDGTKSSESSRVQVTTTSFESSTTDSDSHIKRQTRLSFKGDSGYKSLDTQYNQEPVSLQSSPTNPSTHQRTASRRRRDFQGRIDGPPKQKNDISTSCSSHELDTGESSIPLVENLGEKARVADNGGNGKRKFLHKIFRYPKSSRHQLSQRDYSIDEKSDALFREFTRYEPMLDKFNTSNSPSSRLEPNCRSVVINEHESSLGQPILEKKQDRAEAFLAG